MKAPSFLQPVWQAHWVCLFWFKNTPIHKCFPLLTFYTCIHKHTFCYVVYDFMHIFFFVVVSHSFSTYKLNCDLDDQGNGSLMYTRKLTATNDTKNKTLTCNSKSNFILNYNFQKKKKPTLNGIRKQLYCIPFFFFAKSSTPFFFSLKIQTHTWQTVTSQDDGETHFSQQNMHNHNLDMISSSPVRNKFNIYRLSFRMQNKMCQMLVSINQER